MIIEIDLGVLHLEFDGTSLAELDAKLDEAMREKQRRAFVDCLAKRDALKSASRACPGCSSKMVSLGFAPRKLGTLAGDVSLRRRRLRCGSCGREVYPLDELIGAGGKHTLPAIERALYLATELSYHKASVTLKKLTGADISHGQIQALAKREGALIGQDLKKAADDLFGVGLDPGEVVSRTKDDTLVIAIDGGNIPDRSTRSDFEAKVGVIYGLKAQVSRNRISLVDRVAYASLEDSFKFGQRLFCLARRHGALSAGRVLAIGDGAAWIRHLVKDFFPGAIYLLDLYHLKRKVRAVLSADGDEEVREAVTSACQRGRPDEALAWLSKYRAPTEEKANELRKLKIYIRANSLGISNYARSDLFGSGAVEKAVDLLVSRRFKNRGMSWFRPGAAGMLALRLLRFNGGWDAHWQSRMKAVAEATT